MTLTRIFITKRWIGWCWGVQQFFILPDNPFNCLDIQLLHTVLTFKARARILLFSFSTVAGLSFISFHSLPNNLHLSFFILCGFLPLFEFPLLQPTMTSSAVLMERSSLNQTLMVCFKEVMEDDRFFCPLSVRDLKSREFLEWLRDSSGLRN